MEQRVNDTQFFIVKNLALDILLGTAIINANFKSISSVKHMDYIISSSFVTMKGADHGDSPVA